MGPLFFKFFKKVLLIFIPILTLGIIKFLVFADNGETSPSTVTVSLSTDGDIIPFGRPVSVGITIQNGGTPIVADIFFGYFSLDIESIIIVNPFTGTSYEGRLVDLPTFIPLASAVPIPSGFQFTSSNFATLSFSREGFFNIFLILSQPNAFQDGKIDPGDIIASGIKEIEIFAIPPTISTTIPSTTTTTTIPARTTTTTIPLPPILPPILEDEDDEDCGGPYLVLGVGGTRYDLIVIELWQIEFPGLIPHFQPVLEIDLGCAISLPNLLACLPPLPMTISKEEFDKWVGAHIARCLDLFE